MERRPASQPSRDHPLERAAKHLGIPLDRLQHPPVRTYLAFYCQLERMQQQMGTASTYHPHFFAPEEIKQEISNQLAAGISSEMAVEPTLEPSLAKRYAAAEHLLRIALSIFRDGFTGYEVNPEQVRRNANVALEPFGLHTDYAPPKVIEGPHDHESATNVADALRQWANEQANGKETP